MSSRPGEGYTQPAFPTFPPINKSCWFYKYFQKYRGLKIPELVISYLNIKTGKYCEKEATLLKTLRGESKF